MRIAQSFFLPPRERSGWELAASFQNPNSERELARLKPYPPTPPPPLFCSSLERFTALPIHYSSRSSKQVSPRVWKTYLHTYEHTRWAYTHSHICRFSQKVKLHILWQMTSSMNSVAQLPQNVTLNLTWTLPFSDATFTHSHIFMQPMKGYQPWHILHNHFSFTQHWDLFDRDIIFFCCWCLREHDENSDLRATSRDAFRLMASPR